MALRFNPFTASIDMGLTQAQAAAVADLSLRAVRVFATCAEARANLTAQMGRIEVAGRGSFVLDGTSVVADSGDEFTTAIKRSAIDGAWLWEGAKLAALTPAGTVAVSGVTSPKATVTSGVLDIGGANLGDLLSDLLDACAPKIIDAWIGESLASSSTLAATWPSSLAGGTALTHAGAAGNFPTVTDANTSRRGIGDPTGSHDRALVCATGTAKAWLVVYRAYNVPTTAVTYACAVSASILPMQCGSSARYWSEAAGAGSPVHYRDGFRGASFGPDLQVFYTEISANTTAGIKIGGLNGYSLSMRGEIYAVIPLSAVLTSAEHAACVAALSKYYGIERKSMLVIDGNSIAAGYSSPRTDWWTSMIIPGIFRNNIAVDGRNWTDVNAAREASLATLDLLGFEQVIVFVYEDINSYNYTPGPGRVQTAEQVNASTWEYCEAIRAHGHKVIASTCMPSTTALNVPQEAQRVAGNALKRLNWASHADALIDWALMEEFDDAAGALFSDGLHLTARGYTLFASRLRAVALAL